MPAPTITAVRLTDGVPADGYAQRSMVKAVIIDFDQIVAVDAGAVSVVRQEDSHAELLSLVQIDTDHTTLIVTFNDPTVAPGGSLPDGHYVLTVLAARVRAGTDPMAADHALPFYRLFGDGNGDGTVDLDDVDLFIETLGFPSGHPSHRAYFDFNANGAINTVDWNALRARIGQSA